MGAYGSRGHRLRVTGTLVTDGVRGVRVLGTEASPLSGSAGVMCLLETARPSEHGILRLHLRLAGAGRDGNHGTPVVRASSQNGNNIRNLSVRKTTWMIAARGDNVADAVIECETGGLTAGMYCVSVAPEPGIESYEVTVTLGE